MLASGLKQLSTCVRLHVEARSRSLHAPQPRKWTLIAAFRKSPFSCSKRGCASISDLKPKSSVSVLPVSTSNFEISSVRSRLQLHFC